LQGFERCGLANAIQADQYGQRHIIDMAADRGAFICQSQSMNIYLRDASLAKLTSMHFYGWKKGLKTGSYYIRQTAARQAQKVTVDVGVEKRGHCHRPCRLIGRRGDRLGDWCLLHVRSRGMHDVLVVKRRVCDPPATTLAEDVRDLWPLVAGRQGALVITNADRADAVALAAAVERLEAASGGRCVGVDARHLGPTSVERVLSALSHPGTFADAAPLLAWTAIVPRRGPLELPVIGPLLAWSNHPSPAGWRRWSTTRQRGLVRSVLCWPADTACSRWDPCC
jgi:hypothetical protein